MEIRGTQYRTRLEGHISVQICSEADGVAAFLEYANQSTGARAGAGGNRGFCAHLLVPFSIECRKTSPCTNRGAAAGIGLAGGISTGRTTPAAHNKGGAMKR